MSAAATLEANRSYREVLRNRHVAGLLLGDLLANIGTGMLIELAGTCGGLVLSGVLTLLLLPIAALAVLKGTPGSITLRARSSSH